MAAPGFGKTTLGIELIRRQNTPALILSPSINIRNQWLERIRSAYLKESSGILSNSLHSPGLITAITYQALHSYMTGNGSEEQEDRLQTDAADDTETIDIWQRYINLCGPIDEEIIVPELVKEKNSALIRIMYISVPLFKRNVRKYYFYCKS